MDSADSADSAGKKGCRTHSKQVRMTVDFADGKSVKNHRRKENHRVEHGEKARDFTRVAEKVDFVLFF